MKQAYKHEVDILKNMIAMHPTECNTVNTYNGIRINIVNSGETYNNKSISVNSSVKPVDWTKLKPKFETQKNLMFYYKSKCINLDNKLNDLQDNIIHLISSKSHSQQQTILQKYHELMKSIKEFNEYIQERIEDILTTYEKIFVENDVKSFINNDRILNQLIEFWETEYDQRYLIYESLIQDINS